MLSQLSMRLGDTMAELADEEAKIEKAARRSEHLHRAHERGQITVFDIARSLGEGDEGDEGRVRMLTRRAESCAVRSREAQATISPQRERQLDGVEAAASRAQPDPGRGDRPARRGRCGGGGGHAGAARAGAQRVLRRAGPPPFRLPWRSRRG